MSTKKPLSQRLSANLAAFIIPLSIGVAYLIYTYVLGDPANFVGNSNLNEPDKGNYLGVIYKGGKIVILLIGFQVILLSYIVERFFTIRKARGRERNADFVSRIKGMIADDQNQEAVKACDQQRGTVANVVRSGVHAMADVKQRTDLNKEQKVALVQKELQESTQLEMPHLQNNMVIISTLASISTLIGLLGTVTGMIKAFSALARVGAPDAVGLASGISQALVTTALGISTAAVAIVFFNFFTDRIDKITYAIEESAYAIMNTLKARI